MAKKDLDLLQKYLADSLEWREGSYREPLKTSAEVVAQWRSDLADQTDIQAQTELVAVNQNQGCYHFRASWNDSTGYQEIDGIFLIQLNGDGKIVSFNQWWTPKPA